MRAQAEADGAKIVYDFILSLKKENGVFIAETGESGTVRARAVILATGAKRKKIGVAGEDAFIGRGVSYCASCDGPFFKNKKIFVVGGGDAACDEARLLAELSPTVTLLVRGGAFRAQKKIAERVLADPRITVRFSSRIREIRGDDRVRSLVIEKTDGTAEEEAADAVFVFAGLTPATDLTAVPPCAPAVDNAGFIITDATMATSIAGLFAAGDVRASPFRQLVTACADGAIAAHSAGHFVRSAL
jgi:thioredoxin reductase (NADPH)